MSTHGISLVLWGTGVTLLGIYLLGEEGWKMKTLGVLALITGPLAIATPFVF